MKQKIYYSILIVVLPILLYGQGNFFPYTTDATPPSPNASALGLFGDIPVGHYTGIPQISIPIYTIECGSQKLPIELLYHASGIKPKQEASTVGLGWVLMAGGCITRDIRQLDDFQSNGYYHSGLRPVANNNNMLEQNNINNDYLILKSYLYGDSDGEPDIFKFNFGEYSGNFIFQPKGKNGNSAISANATILKNDKYLTITYNLQDDIWHVKDAYGYSYIFRPSETTKCYNFVNNTNIVYMHTRQTVNELRNIQPQTTTSWYIEYIISPDADTVKFAYLKDIILSQVDVYEDAHVSIYDYEPPIPGWMPEPFKRFTYSYSENEQQLISSITFKNGYIKFIYGNRYDLDSKYADTPARRIDQIKIYDRRNNNILFYDLKYWYTKSFAKPDLDHSILARLMLDEVRLVDIANNGDYQSYKFAYNADSLPYKTQGATDYWGYYTGTAGMRIDFRYAPTFGYAELPAYGTAYGANKESDEEYTIKGMLSSIIYPTGGKTTFEYELHDFSNSFTYSSGCLPVYSSDSTGNRYIDSMNMGLIKVDKGGGLRIKRICNISGEDTTSIKTYTYKKSNGISSGILKIEPNYNKVYDMSRTINFNETYYSEHKLYVEGLSSPATTQLSIISGVQVGYSYVEEREAVNNANNGYTAYSFTNNMNACIIESANNLIRHFPSIPYYDDGNPTETCYYDANNNPVKRITYNYTGSDWQNITKGFVCYSLPMVEPSKETLWTAFYDIYEQNWRLASTQETDYFPSGKSIHRTNQYTYNVGNMLKKTEKTIMNDGAIVETEYKYTNDFTDPVYLQMQNSGIIGLSVESISTRNGEVFSAFKTQYIKTDRYYRKQSVSNAVITQPVSSNDYTNKYERALYYEYHPDGNIKTINKTGEANVVYLWSYDGCYPVAQIKNCQYDKITDILSENYIQSLSKALIPTESNISQLKNLRSIPGSEVTIYTYKPMVGISCVSTANNTIYYEYDSFNRLIHVKDNNGIIEAYNYNYKTE